MITSCCCCRHRRCRRRCCVGKVSLAQIGAAVGSVEIFELQTYAFNLAFD